jgi:hypothetical protein
MALRRGRPLTIRPKGVSDAIDGTNTFPGAMAALTNLVPSPTTAGVFVPRPAAVQLTDFTGFTSPTAITALLVIGARIYGMISSGKTAGYDEPFCYDTSVPGFVAISGVTSANVPASPALTGAWTPPQMVAITSTKIIVTHKGFSGTGTNFFGVIDITTPASPAWSSSNTASHALPAVPIAVQGFNGRAYYAVANALWFSDSLDPLTITNASQVLVLGDSQPVTALGGMPLANQVVGGAVQSLIVFKGAEFMAQITGDPATTNLTVNDLNIISGTLAPNTLVPTPYGLVYVAPDGVRIIGFNAQVSEPLGANGKGVNLPFINVLTPSRMVADFNENTLRVTVQNGTVSGDPYQEYHFDFSLKVWTGPHTCAAYMISSFHIGENTFITALVGTQAKLFTSTVTPHLDSVYTENSVALSWSYQTVLLPDNEQMAMNKVVQTSIALQLPATSSVSVIAQNEVGEILDMVTITTSNVATTIWGSFTWGAAVWGAATGYFQQYFVPWNAPLVFKQASLLFSGTSYLGGAVGNLYLRYQILGYLLPY